MIVHNLKIKYEYAKDIVSGLKTFEIRKDDRNFQVGDFIAFSIIDLPSHDDSGKNFNENEAEQNKIFDEIDKTIYRITYKLNNIPEYGLNSEYCILGLTAVHTGYALNYYRCPYSGMIDDKGQYSHRSNPGIKR